MGIATYPDDAGEKASLIDLADRSPGQEESRVGDIHYKGHSKDHASHHSRSQDREKAILVGLHDLATPRDFHVNLRQWRLG
jgi:hypothetical protein